MKYTIHTIKYIFPRINTHTHTHTDTSNYTVNTLTQFPKNRIHLKLCKCIRGSLSEMAPHTWLSLLTYWWPYYHRGGLTQACPLRQRWRDMKMDWEKEGGREGDATAREKERKRRDRGSPKERERTFEKERDSTCHSSELGCQTWHVWPSLWCR